MATQVKNRTARLLAWGVLFLMLGGMIAWQATGDEAGNPRADFWRVVRAGIAGYSSTPAQGHTVLIQNSGENWREIRNGLIVRILPWILVAALVVIGLFFAAVGTEKLKRPRSGVLIERYSLFERLLHWATALIFIIMAVTGLSLLLGRAALIPVFGHQPAAGVLQAAKILHNLCGPLLLIGILLEFLVWVRDSIPHSYDWQWFRNMGGMIGRGEPPHIGMINGGEKAWFWVVFVFGCLVGVTGVLLDFPFWEQTRRTMQVSHMVHATVALLFVAAAFGHIYMGTLGVEGVFEAMWKGRVDAVFAQQNHDLWYAEVMRKKGV